MIIGIAFLCRIQSLKRSMGKARKIAHGNSMRNYRVYYNRASDFPYVWSFDSGDMKDEVIVKSIRGGNFVSCYDPMGDNLTSPRGYFLVEAEGFSLINGKLEFI